MRIKPYMCVCVICAQRKVCYVSQEQIHFCVMLHRSFTHQKISNSMKDVCEVFQL